MELDRRFDKAMDELLATSRSTLNPIIMSATMPHHVKQKARSLLRDAEAAFDHYLEIGLTGEPVEPLLATIYRHIERLRSAGGQAAMLMSTEGRQ